MAHNTTRWGWFLAKFLGIVGGMMFVYYKYIKEDKKCLCPKEGSKEKSYHTKSGKSHKQNTSVKKCCCKNNQCKRQSGSISKGQLNRNKINLAIATPTDCTRWRGKFRENLGKILVSIERTLNRIGDMEPDCDPTGLASGSSDDNVLRERRDSSRHRLHTYCCNTIGTKRLRGSRSRSTSGADRLRQMISDRRPVEKCKPCPESSSTTSADSPSNTVYCYQTDTGCTGLGDAGRHVESIEEMEDSFHKTMQELDDMNEEFVSSGNRNQGQDNHEVIDLEGMDAEGLKPESLGPRFKEADDGGPAAGPSLSKAKSKDRHKAGPSQASTTNRKACKALPSTKSVHSRKSKTECPSKRTSRAPSRVPSRAFNKSAECATTRSGLGLYRSTERSRPDNCRSGEWPPDRHRRIFQQSELLSSSKCTTAGRRLLPSTTRDCDDEDDIFDNTAVAHKTDACATRKLRFSDDSVNKRC